MPNAEVARIFRDLADLLEINGANAFRVRAYRNAARTVETWTEPLAEVARGGVKELTRLPGVGNDMAGKIDEILRTGSLGQLRQELGRLAPGVLELLRIPGLGPKRVRALFDTGISTLEALERAAAQGRVRKLPGFSQRTEAKLLEEVRTAHEAPKRFLRAEVAVYAEALRAHVAHVSGVHEAQVAGSFRRRKDTVGDLDILVSCDDPAAVTEAFTTYEAVAEVQAKGSTKSVVRLRNGLQVDLRVLERPAFGAGLCYFTGSQAHAVAMRKAALQHGWKLNEYGLYEGERRIAGRTEQEIYDALGIDWIPPELREDRGELDAAREHRLPQLIERGDIRGDLQMHTTASDGRNTLETMARAAHAMGYEYIAVTDHTPLLKMIQGLDAEGFREQWKEIDRLNAKLSGITILKAAEVDIHTDGSLDLDDATLAELDLVQISLHSKLQLPPEEQTRRVVRALQHPSVDVFGHPRGRLLLKRDGAQFDLGEVCRVAGDHGVLMEVNASPDRLDLDDVAVRTALEHGLLLTISTDSHSTRELEFMRWGVDQARRGWATKKDVANTRPLAELLKLLHGKRRR